MDQTFANLLKKLTNSAIDTAVLPDILRVLNRLQTRMHLGGRVDGTPAFLGHLLRVGPWVRGGAGV